MLPTRDDVLRWVRSLAVSSTIGSFVDSVLDQFATALESNLVSYNRIDFAHGVAMVAFRPFSERGMQSLDGIGHKFVQHPVYQWFLARPGSWGPVRISDAMPWDELVQTDLYQQDLKPVGADHMVVVPVVPFSATSPDWTYFTANRRDRDFTDDEIDYLGLIQSGLAVAHATVTKGPPRAGVDDTQLTPRELSVVQRLAEGMTVNGIAHALCISEGTARKHLEHIHLKLGTTDRLSTVMRAHELGYLSADEISVEFRWDVRLADGPTVFRVERPMDVAKGGSFKPRARVSQPGTGANRGTAWGTR
jgi:DNA-binding CsgD family transcriptional regulator